MSKDKSHIELGGLRRLIESKVGFEIADLRFYAAGQNANLYIADLDRDRRRIVKICRNEDVVPGRADMEIEGWMLQYLSRNTKLPVPKVYWYDRNTILMDFVVDTGMIDREAERDAAEKLAALHSVESRFFGLERDTSIIPWVQPNHFESHWPTFFRDHRLLWAAGGALGAGMIDIVLMRKIDTLAAKIEDYIPASARPGLVHGDLWGGNVLFDGNHVSAFIDPAIYYADPEIELAMIDLYGTFEAEFFNRYNDLRPIDPEFYDTRRDIYALYPLLIQMRLGRSDHADKVGEILERFVG